MKVLVTGVAGQLGYDITARLTKNGIENKGVDIADFDLTDKDAVFAAVAAYAPTHIVHCAAYTAVDKAEEERELCTRVNVDGTRFLAQACAEIGAEMMYFSTDYVFDGFSKADPWEVGDPKSPQNHYGMTKYMGELAVQETLEHCYILRISWVFGKNGGNFVKTMLRLGKERDHLTVVSDQHGAPTYTYDVAKTACEILRSGKHGVYHTPNAGETTWYEFAKEIFALAGLEVTVTPVTTADYPTAAKRPMNSRLSVHSLTDAGFTSLPHYSDALQRYLKELE
ncbi:dTDP-4-dehydrorhamnose reductase [Christensenellaceae bacterium OttesenSCG-928-K19]|nr:dTDP-4-dehydrorhamnose reductase [Christensenellaceae bacterium OttesenSCG-928-K19]